MSVLPTAIAQHFAFATGKLSVLKHLLMLTSDRDRLLGAHGLKEAEMILAELKIGSRSDRGDGKADSTLAGIERWVRTEVESMSVEEKRGVFGILWMKEDVPLLSYLLKKHHGKTSEVSHEPQGNLTAWDAAHLHALVANDTATGLDDGIVELVRSVKAMEEPTAKQIDCAVSQGIANMQLALAKKNGSSEIKRYVRHTIDLMNLRTVLRLVDMSAEEVTPYLIKGGFLDTRTLAGNREHVLRAIDRSSLPYTLSQSIRKAGDDWNAIEQAFEGVLAEDISRMWNIPLSVEPLFAFAALTLSHLKLLRAIIIGKRANLSPQEIKKMIPPFIPSSLYVLA